MPDQPPIKKSNNVSDRALGAFALAGGAVLAYMFVIAPLVAASRHDIIVNLSEKAIVVTPVVLTIGVLNIVMGEGARPLLGRRQVPSKLGLIIYVVAFGLGVLLYQWVKSRLQAGGYAI